MRGEQLGDGVVSVLGILLEDSPESPHPGEAPATRLRSTWWHMRLQKNGMWTWLSWISTSLRGSIATNSLLSSHKMEGLFSIFLRRQQQAAHALMTCFRPSI